MISKNHFGLKNHTINSLNASRMCPRSQVPSEPKGKVWGSDKYYAISPPLRHVLIRVKKTKESSPWARIGESVRFQRLDSHLVWKQDPNTFIRAMDSILNQNFQFCTRKFFRIKPWTLVKILGSGPETYFIAKMLSSRPRYIFTCF